MNRQRGIVVELVGPAGAGKTTLAKGVSAVDPSVHAGLSLWGLPRPKLFAATLPLIPRFIASAILPKRRLQWGVMAQMIRLGALRSVVRDQATKHRVIILDEGPVFALSWLDVFFARNGDRVPVSWRRRVVAEWATLLDVVVFIDASDLTLATRIRTREKQHMVKDRPDAEIFGFSGGFRRAFERAIGELKQAGHVVVDSLSTETHPLAEATAQVSARLQQRRNGH